MIKVAIVDDSKTARYALRQALESDSQLLVVAEAATGREALSVIEKYSPDLVTMDVFLENESGLDVTSSIMAHLPRPVVVVTGVNPKDPGLVYKAIGRGALDVLPKLPARGTQNYDVRRKEMLRLLKTLAKVPVLTRRSHRFKIEPAEKAQPIVYRQVPLASRTMPPPRTLLIGASTGGPPVISKLLGALPKPIAIPIVVVQHISAGFDEGFARWLGQTGGLRTVLVKRRTQIEPNTVYVAPDSEHLEFVSGGTLATKPTSATDIICPSIDALFQSGAHHLGTHAAGILLTGMGKDGAAGLKGLRDAGAHTIAQAPETCAVDSMPRTAISIDGAATVLCPEQIAEAICRMLRNRYVQ